MFFKTLGSFVSRFWVGILLFWAILCAALVGLAPNLGKVASSEEKNFLPRDSDSVLAKKLLDRFFPKDSFQSRVVLVAEKPTPLAEEDLAWLDQTAHSVAHDPAVTNVHKVLTPAGTPFLRDKLVSKDGKAALAVLYLTTNFIAKDTQKTVEQVLARTGRGPNGTMLAATGDALVGSDYHHAIGASLQKTTWATLLMLVVILLVIFRSPITPLVSLVSIVVSFLCAKSVAALFALAGATVSPLTEIFLVVVVFGAGTDYCVFLIFRYYEELSRGVECRQAVAAAVQTVGEAIGSSAFTVIIGLGSLMFAAFGPFSQTGPYVALGVGIALCAGLTLTPALILLLHKILFWPTGLLHHPLEPAGWKKVVGWVTRKPLFVCILLVAALSPFIYFGLKAERSFDFLTELPETFPSRQGMEILKNHFSPGEMSPLVLILKSRDKLSDPAGLDKLYQLTSALARRREIREVRSAVWPTGDPTLLKEGLLSSQMEKILAGLTELSDGSRHMRDGIEKIRSKVNGDSVSQMDSLPGQAKLVGDRLDKVIANIETSQEEARKKAKQGGLLGGVAGGEYRKAVERLETLKTGLQQIKDGLQESSTKASESLSQAKSRIAELQEALKKLSDGAGKMSVGLQRVSSTVGDWTSPSSPARAALDHLVLPGDILEKQPKLREALDYYISADGKAARMTLVLNAVPYSRQEKDDLVALKAFLKNKVPEILPDHCRFHFAGSASTILDERIVTDKDFFRVIGYVLAGVFLVLLILLREWVAPLYLIGTMIFSYFVSLGLTALVFEYGMGHAGLDWKVPFFMFVLLVALGEDYNIFLMARIKEETKKQGVLEGVRTATIRTGPLITFCGLIMAGTFLSLMLSPLDVLVQLGFGITLGVLLDTFLVRPLLVPSLVLLIHQLKQA